MFMDVSNGWYIASFFLGAGGTLSVVDGVQVCDFNNEKGLAAGEAIKGIFSGNTDQIEQRVNAEAKKLEERATQICDQLPALLATQQQLAAAIPEFKPYATMDQSDIDEIVASHLRDGVVVQRLLTPPDVGR